MDRDDQRTLELLTEIEKNDCLTQNDLASRMGVAVGLTNLYMKRVVKKGYVKISKLQGRKVRYLLTPKGIGEKTRLAYEFLQYSYQYFRYLREDFRAKLEPFAQSGKLRAAFLGSGEPAELAYLSAKELGMHVVRVVDDAPESRRVADLPVEPLESVHPSECDLILLIGDGKIDSSKEKLIEMGFTAEQIVSTHRR